MLYIALIGVSTRQEFNTSMNNIFPKDETEAVKLIRLAAEQGDADAQINLGGMYFNGQGVPKDDTEAAKWTRLSAEQGNASAQVHLGWMVLKGTGIPKDETEGVRWITLSAEQGKPGAQYSLAWLYHEGWGVPKDHVKAYKYAHLAAEQGDGNGTELRAFIEGRISPEQIAEAQRLAREWMEEFEKRKEE